MNILYISLSCNPYNGSEDKIGWKIPFESAKNHEKVCVITRAEQKKYIDEYFKNNKIENLKFYYVDIPNYLKKIFVGPLMTFKLNLLNKRAVKAAKDICIKNHIDIIHQITPIEFRAIGDYYKVPDIKFVAGPLGGGEYIPKALRYYQKGNIEKELLRKTANKFYKTKLLLSKKLDKCDYVLFANEETKKELNNHCENNVFIETGISEKDLNNNYQKEYNADKIFHILVAGRLVYRKGHQFLLDALEKLPENLSYRLEIVGNGPDYSAIKNRIGKSKKLSNHITLLGRIPYTEMEKKYIQADILIMPSLRETSGNVMFESMSKATPVIAINKFASAKVINNKCGYLYSGNTKSEMVENLSNIIYHCINNPNEVYRKGKNAKTESEKYSWKSKIQFYDKIYENLLKENNKN